MKKNILAALFLAAGASVAMAADADPVLMTVDGKPVHVSEFEYLYNKNNSQQMQKQSIDDYIQMFIDYKLKVADAEHAGLQDTPEFQKEFTNFRAELSAPYLRDNEKEQELIDEAYNHYKDDVYVSHIMISNDAAGAALADSVRTEILAGNISFEDAARKYSIDRNSSARGGRMSYVTPGRFPYAFEKMAYDTPVGEVSPVVNSGMGYHIIRVEFRNPAAGEVQAAHILRVTRGKTDAEIAREKATIDSIYTILQAPDADFAAIATQYSQDPGSAKNGGDLGWFSRGMMVAEFDSTAFAMKDGEISAPFSTAYGYHIIKRYGHRGVAPKEILHDKIVEAMQRDGRSMEPQRSFNRRMMAKYNGKLDQKNLDKIEQMIANNGGYDSTVIAQLSKLNTVVGTYKGGKITIDKVMPNVPRTAATDAANARKLIAGAANTLLEAHVVDIERNKHEKENADYRNLVNEYRDGILLYEIANKNVWDKAAKDTDGLNAFFEKNRDKYTWEKPKFKSYVFFTTSDSLMNVALEYADSLSMDIPAKFTADMRKRFGREIKVERVIAAQGENAITDYLAFGGEKPDSDKSSKWAAYAAYKGRILDAPEEPADMRGAVVTDYQAQLERNWVDELRHKYKVTVNQKVFDKVKADENAKE